MELCFAAFQNCFCAAYRFDGQIVNRQSAEKKEKEVPRKRDLTRDQSGSPPSGRRRSTTHP